MTGPGGNDLLAAIVAATRTALAWRRTQEPLERVLELGAYRRPDGAGFVARLARASGLNVIAECKRRSPSRGVLRRDYDAAAMAGTYEAHGAAAISVLTEPTFFDGSVDDLRAVRARVSLPLLRKDFIVDEYQVVEARTAGADAILLIVAALGVDELRALHERAADLGLAALVEVRDRRELGMALDAGAGLIGVNNRNLRTLAVSQSASLELIESIPEEVVAVAESGLRDRGDLQRLRDAGFDAFLVGERLVSAADPGRALDELMSCS